MKKALIIGSNYNYRELQTFLNNYLDCTLAYDLSEATNYWNKDIDYIVIDLMCLPLGLIINELNQTEGGAISGWIWLKNRVFNNYPLYKKNVIIWPSSNYSLKLLKKNYLSEIKDIKICINYDNNYKKVLEELNKIPTLKDIRKAKLDKIKKY